MSKDVLSNYIGQIVNLILRFFLVPIYLSQLGTSSFGIIGFYFSIESIMVLADFGMGLASAKILAESSKTGMSATVRTIRSVEVIYIVLALVIGLIVFLFSDFISTEWLTISDSQIDGRKTIIFMAVLLTVSWPKSLYTNFLIGRKMITQKNVVDIIFNVLKTASIILVFRFYESSLEMYFVVMIVGFLLEVITLRILAYRLFSNFRGFSSFKDLQVFFKYASGVAVFSILSLVIFQADKFYISGQFDTETLGIYNVSGVFPLAMLSLIYPITSAAFPRLVKINVGTEGTKVYKKWCLILGLISISYFALIFTNMNNIATIWLGEEAGTIQLDVAKLMVLGVLFHAFVAMNLNVLLANSKSRISAQIYSISVLVYLIALFSVAGNGINWVAGLWAMANFLLLVCTLIAFFIKFRVLFKIFMNILGRLALALICILVLHEFFLVEFFKNTPLLQILTLGLATFFINLGFFLKSIIGLIQELKLLFINTEV